MVTNPSVNKFGVISLIFELMGGECSGWHSVRRHTMKAFLIVVILVVILTQPLYPNESGKTS